MYNKTFDYFFYFKKNNVVAGGYFDAFYMYGKTLSELEDCRNNTELLSAMKSTTIVSNDVDGRTIVMNSDGDQGGFLYYFVKLNYKLRIYSILQKK